MTAAGCPAWCNRASEHEGRHWHHGRIIGRDGNVTVTLTQAGYDDAPPPEILIGWYGNGEAASAFVPQAEAAHMSALLDRLGHPAIASLVNIAYGYLQAAEEPSLAKILPGVLDEIEAIGWNPGQPG